MDESGRALMMFAALLDSVLVLVFDSVLVLGFGFFM
jgi:hypothetical protein